MIQLLPYNRRAAVAYAHKWAYTRNPAFYDFSEIGGDCTNFASQCLYAGTGIMNFTPEFGWYYIDATDRAPAWTGVQFFWDFMTRPQPTDGPVGIQVHMNFLRPGDFVQLRFENSGEVFAHTPVIVSVGAPGQTTSSSLPTPTTPTTGRWTAIRMWWSGGSSTL